VTQETQVLYLAFVQMGTQLPRKAFVSNENGKEEATSFSGLKVSPWLSGLR